MKVRVQCKERCNTGYTQSKARHTSALLLTPQSGQRLHQAGFASSRCHWPHWNEHMSELGIWLDALVAQWSVDLYVVCVGQALICDNHV